MGEAGEMKWWPHSSAAARQRGNEGCISSVHRPPVHARSEAAGLVSVIINGWIGHAPGPPNLGLSAQLKQLPQSCCQRGRCAGSDGAGGGRARVEATVGARRQTLWPRRPRCGGVVNAGRPASSWSCCRGCRDLFRRGIPETCSWRIFHSARGVWCPISPSPCTAMAAWLA